MTTEARLPTRQLIQPDVPAFDTGGLDDGARAALVELLLTMADDEFVVGFWDSEWTGIAPMLEEDVAWSSIAQDEIGHARVWYEMLAQLTTDTADHLAFGREPSEYRHARLVDHPRNDWAFSITRRWLYDTADSVRLAALADHPFKPLAEVVAKVRREERYHLMHLDTWLRRLAQNDGMPRDGVMRALQTLAPDASTVFTGPMAGVAEEWRSAANRTLSELDLPAVPEGVVPADGRDHSQPSESFRWLWKEFTSVARLEEGVEW
jgi:ring-1,2-phenylacetyl-CoA epoxidase subunit PaaC